MTVTVSKVDFVKTKKEIRDLKAARTRCWGAWLKIMGLGAIGSVWQSVVTDNWKPTITATAVAVPCLAISPVDFGVTLMFAPPVTSAAMFTVAAKKQRDRFQFITPEDADVALLEKGVE